MRDRQHRIKETLAGSLLVAHPALRDPNFRRSVVLMSAHGPDGAMGVVLNRPLGKRLGDVQGDFALGPLATTPLFHGGPVQTERLILVVWQARPDGFRLHFAVEPSKAVQLMAEEGTLVRGYLGYSGWSAGQLEDELKRGTWVVTDAKADLFERAADNTLWRAVLGNEGDDWRLLADEPDDPALN